MIRDGQDFESVDTDMTRAYAFDVPADDKQIAAAKDAVIEFASGGDAALRAKHDALRAQCDIERYEANVAHEANCRTVSKSTVRVSVDCVVRVFEDGVAQALGPDGAVLEQFPATADELAAAGFKS